MASTIGSALSWWARVEGERTALVVAEESITYRRLQDWSSRIARRLAASAQPGERIGVLGPNSLTWPVIALGVLKTGAVLVPLNPRYKPAELRKVIDDAGIGTVVHPAEFTDVVGETEALGTAFGKIEFGELAALREGGVDDFRIDIEPDDPTALLFTSGSTGMSKGVICTNRTLLSIVFEASLVEKGLHPGATSMLLLPLVFTPGLVWGLVMSMVLGGTLVIETEFVPARAARLLAEHNVETLFGVPLVFESISRTPEFDAADLSSLKTAIVGGAAVPAALLERWAKKGVALRQIYGMTEAGGVATATLETEAADYPEWCGAGSIFTELKVVTEDGRQVEPGEEGEIVLRGPGVTPGYWNDPASTAQALAGGWLRSGDLGRQDVDGRLQFVDRLKDLIITGGINVSPVELERVIAELDGVEEVAVIPAADERFGETPAAIVKAGKDIDGKAVVEHCGRLVADYKVPRYVVMREEPLPRLPSGKLAKVAIRAEYRDIAQRYEKLR